MSANLYTAPIYRLNEDLLRYIVELNADMFADKNALSTTRAASQVCRGWRHFMLSTPMLWSRLIDLDCISRPHQYEWRTELLRRSGTAPLWIRAERALPIQYYDFNHSQIIAEVFLDLIRTHWDRIQKLVARVGCFGLNPSRWAPLLWPAPSLQTFDVAFSQTMCPPDAEIFERTQLFAGYAPALRTFNPRRYRVNVQAPWLAHLHCLVLDGVHTVHEALDALSSTSALQLLKVNDLADEDTSPPFRPAALPRLQSIEFNGNFQLGGALLGHLNIPPACSLKFYGYAGVFYGVEVSEEEILPLISTLAQYARGYFTAYPPRALSLDYFPHQSLDLSDRTSPDDSTFSISIPLGWDAPPRLFELIMRTLDVPALSSATELSLRIASAPISAFVPFLSSLSRVNTIRADVKSLGYLNKIQDHIRSADCSGILFPDLKVIKLDVKHTDLFHNADMTAAAFIQSRTCLRYPINILDLTAARNLCGAPNLDVLEDIKGLKVLWTELGEETVFEYICGSDDPEISTRGI
ncbi:hypothetical protein HYPSUDRAFT_213247 [Hypholoma sublateritium FD-334 SS-4]|uniref:F-box domain-containing protein n=1 Tax=Hypholoma sublateritium (strain FD-334 SS-4) TaxID=945553 RepID=A0A0D2Q5A8_HYPSF|nr:hypothetical protein HYPSUDRAFT_213247 [Hypholoma sublateritium FD-334 SS-4]